MAIIMARVTRLYWELQDHPDAADIIARTCQAMARDLEEHAASTPDQDVRRRVLLTEVAREMRRAGNRS